MIPKQGKYHNQQTGVDFKWERVDIEDPYLQRYDPMMPTMPSMPSTVITDTSFITFVRNIYSDKKPYHHPVIGFIKTTIIPRYNLTSSSKITYGIYSVDRLPITDESITLFNGKMIEYVDGNPSVNPSIKHIIEYQYGVMKLEYTGTTNEEYMAHGKGEYKTFDNLVYKNSIFYNGLLIYGTNENINKRGLVVSGGLTNIYGKIKYGYNKYYGQLKEIEEMKENSNMIEEIFKEDCDILHPHGTGIMFTLNGILVGDWNDGSITYGTKLFEHDEYFIDGTSYTGEYGGLKTHNSSIKEAGQLEFKKGELKRFRLNTNLNTNCRWNKYILNGYFYFNIYRGVNETPENGPHERIPGTTFTYYEFAKALQIHHNVSGLGIFGSHNGWNAQADISGILKILQNSSEIMYPFIKKRSQFIYSLWKQHLGILKIEESQIDILIQALDLEFIKYHDYLFRDTKITCNDFLCYVSHLIVKFSDSFITEWTLLLFKSIFEAYDCDMNTYTKGAQISCGNGIFERMITIIGDLLCPKYDIPRQIVPITEEEIKSQKKIRQERILIDLFHKYIKEHKHKHNKEMFTSIILSRIKKDDEYPNESEWINSIEDFFNSATWTYSD